MAKLNQPLTLELTITTTATLTGATSSYMTYWKPDGTTGTLSTTVLDTSTSPYISYFFSTNVLDVEGEWKITPWVKLSDGYTYPFETYELNIVNEFSTD